MLTLPDAVRRRLAGLLGAEGRHAGLAVPDVLHHVRLPGPGPLPAEPRSPGAVAESGCRRLPAACCGRRAGTMRFHRASATAGAARRASGSRCGRTSSRVPRAWARRCSSTPTGPTCGPAGRTLARWASRTAARPVRSRAGICVCDDEAGGQAPRAAGRGTRRATQVALGDMVHYTPGSRNDTVLLAARPVEGRRPWRVRGAALPGPGGDRPGACGSTRRPTRGSRGRRSSSPAREAAGGSRRPAGRPAAGRAGAEHGRPWRSTAGPTSGSTSA